MLNEANKYDVFLSFVGRDTRYNFTGNLYNALCRQRIKTYMSDIEELRKSRNQVPASALKAIQESRISIVVLSEHYTFSSRCLDELVAILECMNMNKQLVWPIFYEPKPAEVRLERGSYSNERGEEKAKSVFERFEYSNESMLQWRTALSEVSNLRGWNYRTGYEYEYELIRRIVELAVQSLPRYDVFLSFSGEDTRYSFTGFLYNAFRREGFKIFMDDEGLMSGNQISESLITAIEKSRLSIVVFSENYGYSTWCLDEFAKIMECMKTNNQMVWPIFYNVEKSIVCNQTKTYGDAMAAHEKRFGKDSEKVQKWRSALSEIANLEGEHLNENEYQYELIERIVEKAIDIENHKHIPSPRMTATRKNERSSVK